MDMKQMMKQAQKVQANMQVVQSELAEMSNEAEAGGGMVKAKVNGNTELLELTIDPEVVDADDVEMLEDLIIAAVNEAIKGMNEISQQRMQAVTGNLNIPGF